MINLDILNQKKADIMNRMTQAIKDGDEAAFSQVFGEYTDLLQEAVMAEARGMVLANDNTVLAGRGVRVLTSGEKDYYQKLAEAMKSADPKQALTGFDAVLPETIINAVFEDITENHPLLSEIKFENTGAMIRWLYSVTDGRFLAHWGPLCSTIAKELTSQFDYLQFEQTKLSAWLPVCKAMLDLGPNWLDRYVRTILYEAIANGVEKGVICGRGLAEGAVQQDARIYEPIGMDRDLSAYDLTTGYAQKIAIPVDEFSPGVYGGLIAGMAVSPNNLYRSITSVLLVVNPVDYFQRVMPATIYQRADGSYVTDIFPFPTKVVQSAWVTEGTAIIGLPKQYIMAMGTGKDGKIEYSDEYRFLEDERTYLIKLYGTGRPIDNNCFRLLDITGLKPVYPIVRATPYLDARLKSLTVNAGADAIAPAFNSDVHYYEAEVELASGAMAAVAVDGTNASVAITQNGSTVANPASITFAAGANVFVITVTNGTETETYVLVVTFPAA